MKPSFGHIQIPNLLARLGGVISAVLGISVLTGWYTHNETLLQISTTVVPMQFNTALGFLLSGLGLLFVIGRHRGVGTILGFFVMLIGLLTLAEYILGVDLGIDQLFMQHYITTETSHPGRMAPNTALCFSLTGAALIVLGNSVKIRKSSMIVSVLGSLIFGLAFVALAGYAVGLEAAYGWGGLTRMAVHTASGFMILGVAVTSLAWYRSVSTSSLLPSWFPAPVGIGVVTITTSLWQALNSYNDQLVEQYGPIGAPSYVNHALLVIGIVLAAALSLTVFLAQAARARGKEAEAMNRRLAVESNERKQAEGEILRLNEGLERTVSERTLELEAANKSLQELDRLKSMFIASMSHELRTPLNSIIGFSSMIVQDMTGPINDQQRDYLQRVQRAGEHLLSLITDVIDISKIEAGKLAVQYTHFALDEVTSEALEGVDTEARQKGLELSEGIPAGIEMYTDRKRLLQCLLNFLSNAVKYSERGSIRLEARPFDEQVEISVNDTGIGIPEQELGLLFEPFVRLESPLKRHTTGTGLGLYLTRKLAREVLGGEVSVSSQFGKGSAFSLRIPQRMPSGQDDKERGSNDDK